MAEALDGKLSAQHLVGARSKSAARASGLKETCQEEQCQQGRDAIQAMVPNGATQRNVPGHEYKVSLLIHRITSTGNTKVVRLNLCAVAGVRQLKKLFQSLLVTAFPSQLPQYLTSDEYYLFTPEVEFVSLPSNSVRTQFKLVVSVDGWETVVAVRELGRDGDPERRMLVTMAEFDSQPMSMGHTVGHVVSVVAYPSVSVRKSFLDEAIRNLRVEHSLHTATLGDLNHMEVE